MPALARIISQAVDSRTLRKLVLSSRRETAGVPFDKVTVRPVSVRGEDAYQFSLRHDNRETHENLPPADTTSRILIWCATSFADCHIVTTESHYTAQSDAAGRTVVNAQPVDDSDRHTPPVTHDRSKAYLIPEDTPCPFLTEIGVMTASGKVRASQTRKFRQINRFLELINDVLPSLPETGLLQIVDFGSGKSSLTFALHHLLTVVHGRSVHLVGMDRKRQVVRNCQQLAEKLGLTKRGLSFQVGEIAAFPGFDARDAVDLVVSLHACDTATDDALAQAVRWNASVILAVPCCQHEVAANLSKDNVRSLARHGILKERFAALATDALRAEILEMCGYKTQVVEFIDMEHTPKNVLIRAVKRKTHDSARSERDRERQQLKTLLGIERLHLETALGETFLNAVAPCPEPAP